MSGRGRSLRPSAMVGPLGRGGRLLGPSDHRDRRGGNPPLQRSGGGAPPLIKVNTSRKQNEYLVRCPPREQRSIGHSRNILGGQDRRAARPPVPTRHRPVPVRGSLPFGTGLPPASTDQDRLPGCLGMTGWRHSHCRPSPCGLRAERRETCLPYRTAVSRRIGPKPGMTSP